MKRVVSLLLAFVLICSYNTGITGANAASVSAKSVTVKVGQTKYVTLKGTKIKIFNIKNSKVAYVTRKSSKKMLIRGCEKGTTKLTITGKNNKKYTVKITVKASNKKVKVTTERKPVNPTPSTEAPVKKDTRTFRGMNSADSFGTGKITKAFSYEVSRKEHTTESKSDGVISKSSDVTLLSYDVTKADAHHLYHPNGIAYYYDDVNALSYYFVADTWNNRVLIFRCKKDECLDEDTPVYAVLGQDSATTSFAGASLAGMNFPINVAVADLDTETNAAARIFVTDTNNSRILVWNSIPDKSGVAASFQMTYHSAVETNANVIDWPWGVYTDNEKLIVCATRNSKVLCWNKLPNKESDYPDAVITVGGTPRNISFDVKGNAYISDHNIGETAGVGGSEMGTRVILAENWNKLINSGSTTYQYDYLLTGGNNDGLGQIGSVVLSDKIPALKGALVVFAGWEGLLHVYKDGVIDSPSDYGDYTIWSKERDRDDGFVSFPGDLNSIIQDVNGNIYAVCYNGNKVVGHKASTFPTKASDKEVLPDLSWGVVSKDETKKLPVNANITDEMDMMQNCHIDIRNNYLVVSDDLNQCFAIYKGIPDTTGTVPDVMVEYHQNGTNYDETAQDFDDICLFDSKDGKTGLIVGGRKSINVWYDINDVEKRKDPDLECRGKLGNVNIEQEELITFDYDGKYFYAGCNNKIYVFEGLPKADDKPVAVVAEGISRIMPAQINVTVMPDGTKYLVNTVGFGTSPTIYDVTDITNVKKIGEVKGEHSYFQAFNGCFEALVDERGRFIAVDGGFSHVDIWNNINDAIAGKEPSDVIGFGADFYSSKEINPNRLDTDICHYSSPTTLNIPYFVCYDSNGYIWTADFKFGGGVRRFKG